MLCFPFIAFCRFVSLCLKSCGSTSLMISLFLATIVTLLTCWGICGRGLLGVLYDFLKSCRAHPLQETIDRSACT